MAQLTYTVPKYDINSIDLRMKGTAVVNIPEREKPYMPPHIVALQGKTIEIGYYLNDDAEIAFYGGLGNSRWLWALYELKDITLPMPTELAEEEG